MGDLVIDEGSKTGSDAEYAAGVGALHLDRGQLHYVLEEALLLLWRDAVELVQVDEQHLRHGQVYGAFFSVLMLENL